MTISQAYACKARGMTREAILADCLAAQAAERRALEQLTARVYAHAAQPNRPAYPSEVCRRQFVAYDYDGR